MAVGQVVPEALTYMAAFDQRPGETCECWGEMIQAGVPWKPLDSFIQLSILHRSLWPLPGEQTEEGQEVRSGALAWARQEAW